MTKLDTTEPVYEALKVLKPRTLKIQWNSKYQRKLTRGLHRFLKTLDKIHKDTANRSQSFD